MMLRLFALFALIEFVSGAPITGWTYKTTPATCAGTVADPCGPVSFASFDSIFNSF
jgi:hypothetical protein